MVAPPGDASPSYLPVYEGVKGWWAQANCIGVNPDIFFPERGGDHRTPRLICQQCEVRQDCLDHAIANREYHGVWGGMGERERRREVQRRRKGAA